jgi:O-antigen/teichoic acid export membrane protein
MDFRTAAISGIKWTSIGTVGRALFQLLQISILTRFLPAEAFGLVAMAMFAVQFSNIFVDMGMTSAILHRQNATQGEYSSIYWLNLAISLVIFGMLVTVASAISRFYEEPELRMLIPILGTNILIMAVGRQHRTIMQKQFHFRAIAYIEFVSIGAGLIVAIVLAIKNFGVYSLVYSTLAASLISNGLFLVMNIKKSPIWFHFKFRETIPFLRIGGYTMGSTVLDFFSSESDVLIIGKMLGADMLGVYSLSKQIVIKLFSIVNPIVINVLSPLLSSIQNQKERLRNSFLKVIKYLGYINFPVYILIVVASREILHFVYGPEYAEAYLVLSLLAFTYCLSALFNPVGSLQIATGRTDIGFMWTLLRVIITPAFIYIGATRSMTAVAAAQGLLSLLYIIPLWYMQLRPMANIKLNDYLSQFYRPLFFLSLATIVMYFLGDKLFVENLMFNAILKSASTLIAFAVIMFFSDRKSICEFYNSINSILLNSFNYVAIYSRYSSK